MGVIIMVGEKPKKCFGKFEKAKPKCEKCPIKRQCKKNNDLVQEKE